MKILLFDIDGTLVNTKGAGSKAVNKTFKKFFNIKNASKNIEFHGKTDPMIYREIAEKYNITLSDKLLTELFKTFSIYLEQQISELNFNPVIKGVYTFLDYCKSKNYILGLLTGNIKKGAELKLKPWNLLEYFSFGAFSDDSAVRNKLVNIAISRIKEKNVNLDNNNIYVIGDTPLDIECAKVNKVNSVAVATNKYSKNFLNKFSPDYCVNNLTELINII